MTPEQLALLKKASDSLRAARLLANQAFFDFAASRAYFTMFYVAEAFLLDQGLAFSSHSAVIAAFGRQFTKTGLVQAEFHRYLIEGQKIRHVGDYDTGPGLTDVQAAEQIARAEQFLELSERIWDPPHPLRAYPDNWSASFSLRPTQAEACTPALFG
jgi:uncharacterized protein (UPF0332 family)